MERKYAPYSKWLGTAFVKFTHLEKARADVEPGIACKDLEVEKKWLGKACLLMVQQHNALKMTRPVATEITNYYNRPYKVIFAERLAAAIEQVITDPKLKKI